MSEQDWQSPSIDTVFSPDKALACIRVAGDVDTNSWQDLADLHALLAHAGSTRILVDLATTTFAGVTLMAFLARLASETGAAVILCRPTEQTGSIILATDVVELFRVTDELPPDWIDPMDSALPQR